jgi:hypothetical protein
MVSPDEPKDDPPRPLNYQPEGIENPVDVPDVDADYVDPNAPRWRLPASPRQRFGFGLVGGSVASIMFWTIVSSRGWAGHQPVREIAICFIVMKFTLGVALTFLRGWTAMGLGVLLSMGVGALVLAGTCFAAFS